MNRGAEHHNCTIWLPPQQRWRRTGQRTLQLLFEVEWLGCGGLGWWWRNVQQPCRASAVEADYLATLTSSMWEPPSASDQLAPSASALTRHVEWSVLRESRHGTLMAVR